MHCCMMKYALFAVVLGRYIETGIFQDSKNLVILHKRMHVDMSQVSPRLFLHSGSALFRINTLRETGAFNDQSAVFIEFCGSSFVPS